MDLLKRHPLITYFMLTFGISWGGTLLVIGLDGVLGTRGVPESRLPLVYLATLAGPTVAGLLMTVLTDGMAGLAKLRDRLRPRGVGWRWYLPALLVAPLVLSAVLALLTCLSPTYAPSVFVSPDKPKLLLTGLVAGLMVGVCEELGWSGFALPSLRRRYGTFTAGAVLGFLWGLWHLPLFSGMALAVKGIPPGLYLAVLLFSFLPPFRVLMTWAYEHSGNLLLMMLMHTSLTASILILPPQTTAEHVVTYDLIFGAALWVLAAAVVLHQHKPDCGKR